MSDDTKSDPSISEMSDDTESTPSISDAAGAPSTSVGSGEGVTRLYLHDCAYGSCPSRWSKFPNHESDQNALKNSIKDSAIVHRHHFNDKKWMTGSFTIQDPAMRAHLLAALAGYQDYHPELEEWTFRAPYSALVHRWDHLNDLADGVPDVDAKRAVNQLMLFLGPILAASVGSLAHTRKTNRVMFKDVWQIFPPGELAVASFFGVDAVARVLKYELNRDRWDIDLEYVDWNGERTGYSTTKVTVWRFDGFKFVTSLSVYPLAFSSSAAAIREQLVTRGRKFEQLRGYHFRNCVGSKILLETRCPEERPVSGRVIIDSFAYFSANNKVKTDLRSLSGDEEKDKPKTDARPGKNNSEMTAVKVSSSSYIRTEHLEDMTDEQCLMATPWLRGLDLKTKDWAMFLVDKLSDIVWNDEAFEYLILPGDEKELAWSIVESKALGGGTFDDFVQDKGRGIIVLMFGPPGVGKTLTAEAVAERSRVPLYAMSAGTLGTKPTKVEEALTRALELCKLWNAMLLLDEADVFLAARSNTDLARNELVAVFLTQLEYYPGIAFLTTNRIASIDHAFESRVDLFLRYQDLTPKARRQVWGNFMDHAGRDKFEVNDADLDELSRIGLNGREIKNLIKSAHMLTLKNGDKITAQRLTSLAYNRIEALGALTDQ